MVLNKIIYGFMWLEVVLVAILVAPTRLGIARLLSRVLSVHNPKAFYNRYGSSVVGAIIFLIVLVVYSIVDAYRLRRACAVGARGVAVGSRGRQRGRGARAGRAARARDEPGRRRGRAK